MSTPTYLEDFHWIVTSGLTCGLDHPIEWAVNAVRTPGGTLSDDYYTRMRESVPRFLTEMYEAIELEEAAPWSKVQEWVNHYYQPDHPCQGFFDSWSVEAVAEETK